MVGACDGKGDERREVGMDPVGMELLRPWLTYRVQIPVGPLFCAIADVIQRQLGHANLGVTSVHLRGIDDAEIIDTVHARGRR